MNKRILIINIILFYFVSIFNIAYASDDIFQGRVETQNATKKEQNELFTGSIDKLNHNDVLKMTVSRVLDASKSKENDEFFAEVTDDVEGNGGIIIPRGTVAHGYIKKVTVAKNFSRNGLLDLNFDYLITPDGKETRINGKMSTRLHPVKAASEALATNLVYTTAGGVTGGLLALNFAGIAGSVSSSGGIIAGGAALGSSVGLGMALCHKGKDVLISPGDEILVKICTSANLPVYKKTAFPQRELTQEGLNVKIDDVIYKKNLYGEADKIILSLKISNMTNKTFSTFDLALVNSAGKAYYPDIFDDTKLFSEIKCGDTFIGKIPFSVDKVKDKFWLTFYDNKTRGIISEISIDNAYKEVSDTTHKQNEKLIKKRKDFYKDYNPFDN